MTKELIEGLEYVVSSKIVVSNQTGRFTPVNPDFCMRGIFEKKARDNKDDILYFDKFRLRDLTKTGHYYLIEYSEIPVDNTGKVPYQPSGLDPFILVMYITKSSQYKGHNPAVRAPISL